MIVCCCSLVLGGEPYCPLNGAVANTARRRKSRSSTTLKYRCLLQPRGARGDIRISCGIRSFRISGRIKFGQHLFCGGISSSGCLLYPCASSRKIFRNAVAVVIHHAEVRLRNGYTCLSRSSKPRRCFRVIAVHSAAMKIKSADHPFCHRRSLVSRFTVPIHSFAVILGCALPIPIHGA